MYLHIFHIEPLHIVHTTAFKLSYEAHWPSQGG